MCPKGQLRILQDQKFQEINYEAGGYGYGEETKTEPGEEDSGQEGGESGPQGGGGGQDSREGHDCQGYIGYVVKEGTDKFVFDFFADQGQGKNADSVGHGGHDEDVDIKVMIHCLGSPLRGIVGRRRRQSGWSGG